MSNERGADWTPTAGVDRERMPGVHLGWIVGSRKHSGATWHREGMAVLSLHRDGPHGYSAPTMAEAMRLLDMDTVHCVPLYRRLPSGPRPSLVHDAVAAIARAEGK
jgi:hypothetical protein